MSTDSALLVMKKRYFRPSYGDDCMVEVRLLADFENIYELKKNLGTWDGEKPDITADLVMYWPSDWWSKANNNQEEHLSVLKYFML